MSNLKAFFLRIATFPAICTVLLGVYALVLFVHATDVAGGSDSAGYLTSARLITEGRWTTPARIIPELPADDPWPYTPLGMIAGKSDGALRPTYPVGLPLHFAGASLLVGWTWGPKLVNVFAALASLVFTYACARELGVRRLLAALAAGCLAISPLVILGSIQPLSDTLSMAWNVAAFACALRARRTRAVGWSIACGAAVAVSVLVRPTDVFLLPSLILVLWSWKHLLAAIVGGLPGAIFLGWYQATLYGSPFISGYGSIFALFHTEWLERSLSAYVAVLPPLLPLSVLAVVVIPWMHWKRECRLTAALVLWFVAFAAFFAFYKHTHEDWWYLRFIQPAFPAIAIIAAVGCENLAQRRPGAWPRAVAPALMVIAAIISLYSSWGIVRRYSLLRTADGQHPYKAITLWARDNLPEDAVVLTLHTSCSLYFYTDLPMIRSDLIRPERFITLRERLRESGRPTFAILRKHDDEPRLQEQMPGDWVEMKREGDFGLWRLEHR